MKYTLCLLCTLLLVSRCIAQENDYNQHFFKFNSYLKFSFGVNEHGQLMLCNEKGELVVAKQVKGKWERLHEGLKDIFYEHLLFFNNDTGIIVSNGDFFHFIAGSTVLQTSDGGRSWERVLLTEVASRRIDDGTYLNSGQAWLFYSSGYDNSQVADKPASDTPVVRRTPGCIYYTNDFGHTWLSFKTPGNNQRFCHIFFNDQQQGLIGSLWNVLAYTADNCSSWNTLPTPLDQGKYNKTAICNRPQINNVAIWNDYFLVRQEELVFYSKRNKINWKCLPGIKDFFTDAATSSLYFVSDRNEVNKINSRLQSEKKYTQRALYLNAVCKNGSFYTWDGSHVTQYRPDGEIVSSPLYAGKSVEWQPTAVGHSGDTTYGLSDNKLYQQQTYGLNWDYNSDLPFKINKGTAMIVAGKQLLYTPGNDSLYYYGIDTKQLKKVTVQESLSAFYQQPVKSIAFIMRGSVFMKEDTVVYKRNNQQFERPQSTANETDTGWIVKMPATISTGSIDSLAGNIKNSCYQYDKIADFKFSKQEYQHCKKQINTFQLAVKAHVIPESPAADFWININNLNFDRLIDLVDSIPLLDSLKLHKILVLPEGLWSNNFVVIGPEIANLGDFMEKAYESMKKNNPGGTESPALLKYLLEATDSLTWNDCRPTPSGSWNMYNNWVQLILTNQEGHTLIIRNFRYQTYPLFSPWTVELDGYVITEKSSVLMDQFMTAMAPPLIDKEGRQHMLQKLVKAMYFSNLLE
ncbi:hypothetical protein CLV51_104375 [Chitinophaga niastensis]|uniref:Photosynthesis system II assembly factor Ycf48/Hcf136-like domain-containing protein n=1 Tax=Chitinophaga niastensis TaxID=536980 RepID=A0A2P8HHG2_CHINA|nr:hypothetical protein [Chitinophaga niastensis]PSL45668.1 hypothetical protein CLV51_104375 [Chitinophaga niastensis]